MQQAYIVGIVCEYSASLFHVDMFRILPYKLSIRTRKFLLWGNTFEFLPLGCNTPQISCYFFFFGFNTVQEENSGTYEEHSSFIELTEDTERNLLEDSYDIIGKNPKVNHNYDYFINDNKERWKLKKLDTK